jgi:hypothetical protein
MPGHAADHFRQAPTSSMTCWLFLHPLHYFCIFYIRTLWAVRIFEFRGIICAHIVFNYVFYFNYDLFSFVSLI